MRLSLQVNAKVGENNKSGLQLEFVNGGSLAQMQTYAEEERKGLSVFSSGGVQFLSLAVSMCLVM